MKSAVATGQLEACLQAGMVTETELEREGILTRTLHARALVVKPLGQRPLRQPGGFKAPYECLKADLAANDKPCPWGSQADIAR